MKIKAKLYNCNIPDRNGVVFQKEAIKKAIDNFNNKPFPNFIHLGTDDIDSPVNLKKIAGTVTLELSEDFCVGRININDSPYGNIAKELINSGVLSCKSFGNGTIVADNVTQFNIDGIALTPQTKYDIDDEEDETELNNRFDNALTIITKQDN